MKVWNDCSHKERIARWENAVRVLRELTPHQRRRHWNMGWWGEKTACGTVACAAGHCGLDPWFRRRGLKLDFSFTKDEGAPDGGWWSTEFGTDEEINGFFGRTGACDIFWRGSSRSVGDVIKEMKVYLKRLKADVKNMEGFDMEGYKE